MKSYILALVGAVLLSAVVSLLVSSGKMGRFVKGMTKLFVFAVLAAPLLGLFRPQTELFSADIGWDEGYLDRCCELLAAEREEEIRILLEEEYGVTAETTAVYEADGGPTLRKITLKIGGDGIFGQDAHIDMAERIERALEERYGCEVEILWRETS